MSIPFATTKISVLRNTTVADDNEYDSNASPKTVLTTVASGIRANINSPLRPSEVMAQGTKQTKLRVKMQCDPCDLRDTDLVKDLRTSYVYEVMWVLPRDDFGISYMQAEVTVYTGTEYGAL